MLIGKPTALVNLLSPSIRLGELGVSIFLASGILSNQIRSTVDVVDPVAFNVTYSMENIRNNCQLSCCQQHVLSRGSL
jgi:hypothetical protein